MGAPRVTFWNADEYTGIYLDNELIYHGGYSAVGNFSDHWLGDLLDRLGVEVEVDSFENIGYIYEEGYFPEVLKEEHRTRR